MVWAIGGTVAFTATFQSLPTSASIDPTMWNILKVIKIIHQTEGSIYKTDGLWTKPGAWSVQQFLLNSTFLSGSISHFPPKALSVSESRDPAGGAVWSSSLKDQVVKKPLWKDCRFWFLPHETILGNYLLAVSHLVCYQYSPGKDGLWSKSFFFLL